MNMMDDGRVLPKPSGRGPYGFLIATAIAIVGLVALGTWQVQRLADKELLIADRQAMLVQAPLDLTLNTEIAHDASYRRVMVSGRFLHEKELLVGPRSRRGAVGWKVITPLKRDDGVIVLVDRGWVADSRKVSQTRQAAQISGLVKLTGFARRVSARGPFVPDNDAAKGNWFWTDPVSMAKHLKLSRVKPYWVVAALNRDRRGGPI
jgi:surfeit locus 1 family protein